MRKILKILGTLLTVIILLSGSVVAAAYYAESQTNIDCINPDEALGKEDYVHATIGKNTPSPKLGTIWLEFTEHWIPPDTEFTVFANSSVNETYAVQIINWNGTIDTVLGLGYDVYNCVFTTPSDPGMKWRYVQITGVTGLTSWPDDPIYGPEIDAVGWG